MKLLALALVGAAACQLGSLDAPAPRARQYVSFAAEPQVVAAGKRTVVELHFRVLDGFHINSHTPKSELLIPTQLELEADAHVKAAAAEYPAGQPYSFSFDPTEKLDVYADDFVVKLPVTAASGAHELRGTLHYQACDKAACYPPRSLSVVVPLTAK